jgi:hypothetical protein
MNPRNWLWAGWTEFNFQQIDEVQIGSYLHPSSYLVITGATSLGVRRPESENDDQPHNVKYFGATTCERMGTPHSAQTQYNEHIQIIKPMLLIVPA